MYCWRTALSCSASLRAVHWFDAVFLCINTFNLPSSSSLLLPPLTVTIFSSISLFQSLTFFTLTLHIALPVLICPSLLLSVSTSTNQPIVKIKSRIPMYHTDKRQEVRLSPQLQNSFALSACLMSATLRQCLSMETCLAATPYLLSSTVWWVFSLCIITTKDKQPESIAFPSHFVCFRIYFAIEYFGSRAVGSGGLWHYRGLKCWLCFSVSAGQASLQGGERWKHLHIVISLQDERERQRDRAKDSSQKWGRKTGSGRRRHIHVLGEIGKKELEERINRNMEEQCETDEETHDIEVSLVKWHRTAEKEKDEN